MSVQKFSETQRPTAARTAAIKTTATGKLTSAAQARASVINQFDTTANRLSVAFNSARKFTPAEVKRVIASLRTMYAQLGEQATSAQGHLNTALRLDIPTSRIVAQIEDVAALRGKIAVLHSVAKSTLAADEDGSDGLVQIDDSGYVMNDAADDVLNDLPEAPASTAAASRRRRAEEESKVNLGEQDLDGVPVGHPDEALVTTQTDPSDAGSRGSQSETDVELSEPTDLYDNPIGLPSEDGKGGAETPSYSQQDPSTSAPSTTLAQRRRKAEDDSSKPDFLSTSSDEGFEPPAGQDLEGDTVARRSQMQQRQRRADANDQAGDQTTDNRNIQPGDVSETVKVAQRNRRADGNPPPAQDPAAAPAAPVPAPAAPAPAAPGLDPTAGEDDGLGGLGLDPSLDPTAGDDGMGLDPAMDPSMDPSLDPTAGDGDDLSLEMPDAGIDDMLQGEILSDDDFLSGGDDVAPAAPAADPSQLQATARAARRLTAGRTAGANPAGEADVFKAMVNEAFN